MWIAICVLAGVFQSMQMVLFVGTLAGWYCIQWGRTFSSEYYSPKMLNLTRNVLARMRTGGTYRVDERSGRTE